MLVKLWNTTAFFENFVSLTPYFQVFLYPFPHKDTFWRVWEQSPLKTCGEKEKLLVQATSHPPPNVFHSYQRQKLEFVVTFHFSSANVFNLVQNCVVWEWVENVLSPVMKNCRNFKVTQCFFLIDIPNCFSQSETILLSKLENLGDKDEDCSLEWVVNRNWIFIVEMYVFHLDDLEQPTVFKHWVILCLAPKVVEILLIGRWLQG